MIGMKEEEGEARRALRLINSLISSSYALRSFPVKWHAIRDKLKKLESGIIAASIGTGRSLELDELLESVTATVKEAQLIVDQCCGGCYNNGKLQLRSNLDSIVSRLGLHLKRLDEMYASSKMTHSRAIILSRPAFGASRDDMRLYVKDLCSRLRIGDSELRSRALVSLNEILSDDEKYVSIMVSETLDGITLLVSLLESGDVGIQEAAAEATEVIVGFESYRGVLGRAGAIGPLISVLETGSELAKERAGRALMRMTANSDNCWSVSAQGGVSVLIKICGSGRSSKELISSALTVLKNISSVSQIKNFMVEEGAIAVLAKLSKEEGNQIQAIDFLTSLAYEDESVKQRVVKEGVVESLVYILEPKSHHSAKVREVALRAIETCCFTSTKSANILLGSGFLDSLLFFLKKGDISVKELALKSVSRLCLVSEEAKKSMGELGFMSELVTLLDVRSSEVRDMAAEALCVLISVQRNRRTFAQDQHNVDRIVRLLDPEEEKPVGMKKLLLSVLLALTDSNSGRRKIAASCYVGNLEKLAQNGVCDAKKIVEKLSSNRLRNMFNGIWSF